MSAIWLTPSEVERLRRRRGDPAFARAWHTLQAAADSAAASNLVPPVGDSGWPHHFFCPTHAVRLAFEPQAPGHHACPVDGELVTGVDVDEAWRAVAHQTLGQQLLDTTLAWTATGERGYHDRAVSLLTEYARQYANYPVHGRWAGQGRALGQSLDEAVWGIKVVRAYSLLKTDLDEASRSVVVDGLLRPLGAHVLTQLVRKFHNIECWHLAALAHVAVELDDHALLEPVLDPTYGLPGQLEQGALADGWWREGSPGYHFYAVQAIQMIIHPLRDQTQLLGDADLARLLIAPLELMRSDHSLPALNDGWAAVSRTNGLTEYLPVYEVASALTGDPRMVGAVAGLVDAGGERTTMDSLVFGPDLGGVVLPAPVRSRAVLQEASGYAVLKDGVGESERWAMLKFGPHGGGHGHPDKLHVETHAFGTPLSADLGTAGYGIDLQRTWFSTSLAHNTVVLDETDQPPASGRLVQHDETCVTGSVSWEGPGPYAGVTLTRTLAVGRGASSYFVDVVRIDAPDDHQIDLAWHHRGRLTHDDPSLAPTRLDTAAAPYGHLTGVRSTKGSRWAAEVTVGDAGTRVWGIDPTDTTRVTGRAPGNPADDALVVVLRRVRGAQVTFVTVQQPVRTHEPGTVTAVGVDDLGDLVISHGDSVDRWSLVDTADGALLSPQPPGHLADTTRSARTKELA